jgi:hypothetical protein
VSAAPPAPMTAPDRIVVAAIVVMYAIVPLYGALAALDPSRPPIPFPAGAAGAIAVAALALAAAAICAWGAVRRPPPLALAVAQIGPGAAIVPAALFGFEPLTGFALATIVLALGAVASAVYGYSRLPGVTRAIAIATLISAILAALLALAMVVSRHPFRVYAYNNGRAVGTFLNANELAAYLLVTTALALGIALFGREPLLRRLGWTAAVTGALAFALTFSRWGEFAAAVGIAWFAWATRDRRALIVLVLLVAVAAALEFGPGREHHSPRDDVARGVAWTTGLRTWLHFPLTGVGPFAYSRTYDVFRPPDAPGPRTPVAYDPHSLPLAFLAESGLVGFAMLFIGWTIHVREIARALRTAAPARRAMVLALAAGIVALNVHVLLNTISIYFVLGMQGAALALVLAQPEFEPYAA